MFAKRVSSMMLIAENLAFGVSMWVLANGGQVAVRTTSLSELQASTATSFTTCAA
jgi:hypothetical protein